MSTELKPCPFCGKPPREEGCQRRYDFDFAIECECGACLSQCIWEGGHGQPTRELTIAQWNTRAGLDGHPADAATIIRLGNELARLKLAALGQVAP